MDKKKRGDNWRKLGDLTKKLVEKKKVNKNLNLNGEKNG